MTDQDARELLDVVTKIARSLARIEVQLCGERPAKPPGAKVPARDLVSVVHTDHWSHEEAGDSLPPSGGVPPEEFFRRKG